MASHPHFVWADLFRRTKSDETTLQDVLKENVLFRTLTGKELKQLSTVVYERVYQADEAIFRQNDRGLGMYIIAKGRIAIKTHTQQGEVLVTTLGEGSFFGEIALVEPDSIRTASAIPTERTVLIGFFKPDLIELLSRKPSMGVKILFQLAVVLGRRLSETTEKITSLRRQLDRLSAETAPTDPSPTEPDGSRTSREDAA